jgi:multimeric flavodoxin WrbA
MDPRRIVAIYGSPRRRGNTATLLKRAVEGARAAGAAVEEIVLRDLKLSACLEIYACKQDGECRIRDDYQRVRDLVLSCGGLMLASPIFYYAVSAHTKILMERFHSVWVKRNWVDGDTAPFAPVRKGLFISAGATRGRKLFEGAVLSVRYFFKTLDMELWKALLYRELDAEGDVLSHPEYLDEAYRTGAEFAAALQAASATPPADSHGRPPERAKDMP